MCTTLPANTGQINYNRIPKMQGTCSLLKFEHRYGKKTLGRLNDNQHSIQIIKLDEIIL